MKVSKVGDRIAILLELEEALQIAARPGARDPEVPSHLMVLAVASALGTPRAMSPRAKVKVDEVVVDDLVILTRDEASRVLEIVRSGSHLTVRQWDFIDEVLGHPRSAE